MAHTMLLIGTIMTMSNACLGAALLQLPYRFATLGYILGSIYFVIVVIYSIWGAGTIAKICGESHTYSVRSLMMRTCGSKVTLLIDICNIGMFFGFICTYTVIGADYIHSSFNWITGTESCIQPMEYDEQLCQEYDEC